MPQREDFLWWLFTPIGYIHTYPAACRAPPRSPWRPRQTVDHFEAYLDC